MRGLLIGYCLCAGVVLAALLAVICIRSIHMRRRVRRDAELERHYLRVVVHALRSDDGEMPFFPCLGRAGTRLVLAGTLARLAASTYGADPEVLRRIVVGGGLQEYLLRRAHRARGYRRAWFLSLLARLPADVSVAPAVVRYASDTNRSVRFYALLVRLLADPSRALRFMADYPDPFSATELAEIMSVLRRGVLPIAYEPLMDSVERNLRSVGLCIVRQFGIEQAEGALLRMAASDSSSDLGAEAVYTLCALRRPLCRQEVARRVAVMTAVERRSLLRYMALEGYAEDALDEFSVCEDRTYYESLVHSYKRSLVWL